MNFDFTEEQQHLRQALQHYLRDRYQFQHRELGRLSETGWRPEVWQSFANELCILGAALPDRVGGIGGGPVETMIILEELGANLVLEPYLESVVVCGTLLTAACGENADRELELLINGHRTLAFAWSEPRSRYDLNQVETNATRVGAGWRVSGRKTVVTGAPWASHLILTARTGGHTADASGISLFLIDKNLPGVSTIDYATVDGRRASEVEITQVELPDDSLIGAEGRALPALERARDYALAGLCAEAVGAMTRMLDDTINYTKQRRQFGQPIANFQVLQHRMVDMFMHIEAATSASYLATLSLEADPLTRAIATSSAKVTIGNACRFVGQNAVQLHGGMGMTDDLALTHYFRRLIAIESDFGGVDYHLARCVALSSNKSACV